MNLKQNSSEQYTFCKRTILKRKRLENDNSEKRKSENDGSGKGKVGKDSSEQGESEKTRFRKGHI